MTRTELGIAFEMPDYWTPGQALAVYAPIAPATTASDLWLGRRSMERHEILGNDR
jgi:hypothetical protein